jgi:hypothetical protein
MAGFCEFVISLQTPNLGSSRAKYPIVSGGHLKNSLFREMGPENGFDVHCVAELAVPFAKFSALAAGKLGMPSPHCRPEATVQRHKISGISQAGRCRVI